jgi:hypothetical protein
VISRRRDDLSLRGSPRSLDGTGDSLAVAGVIGSRRDGEPPDAGSAFGDVASHGCSPFK